MAIITLMENSSLFIYILNNLLYNFYMKTNSELLCGWTYGDNKRQSSVDQKFDFWKGQSYFLG